jgi:HK97 family phage major capsid protein
MENGRKMKVSLEKLSRQIGDARTAMGKLNDKLQAAFAAFDAKEDERDKLANELDGLEGEPTSEQVAQLDKLNNELREMRLQNIGLTDEINKAKNALVDMENDLKLRQASNDLDDTLSSSAGRVTGGVSNAGGLSSQVNVMPRNAEQRRHDLRVHLCSLIIADQSGGRVSAAQVASEFDGGEYTAARLSNSMLASDFSQGGSWVRGEFSDTFIELLRPESIVRQMGVDTVPLEDGTMDMPRETGAPTGRYLGEDEDALAETVTTGDLKLIAKEMVCLVPASDKLLRSRSANAAERIMMSIVRSAANTEDLHFIRGVAAGAGPTGMRFLAPAANVLTMNATINLQNVDNDLGKMELALLAANVRMRRAGWLMAPRTFVYLQNLRDGNGNLVYPTLSMLGPTGRPMLRLKPVFITTQIPVNLSGNQSEIILADAEHLIIGDAPRVGLDASNTAAYRDAGGNMRAAFAARKTVIRLVVENDFNALHTSAIAVLTGVTWGAA